LRDVAVDKPGIWLVIQTFAMGHGICRVAALHCLPVDHKLINYPRNRLAQSNINIRQHFVGFNLQLLLPATACENMLTN
jgi:hypothetical protein